MKRLQYILISFLVMVFTACQDDSFEANRPGELDANGNMLVRFGTEIPEMPQMNTRAVDPDGYGVRSLWLFCFDKFRHYTGHVAATNVTSNDASENGISGGFEATIPGSTRYIHFIANLNVNDFEDVPNLGRLDTEVIPQFTTTSGLLSYWGYMKFESEEALKTFASGAGSKVSMFRNQARVRYQREGTGLDLSIKGMAIINQYSRGTVAPFNKNVGEGGDPFYFANAADITSPTLCADDEVLVAVDPTDVSQFTGGMGRFVFEHANAADDPMSLIFRINKNGGSAEDGNRKEDDKYYKIALVDADGNSLSILRNHDYVVNFKGIPETGGYDTFAEAVAGAAANNVWVSIDQTIPSISDGTSALSIVGETTQIITQKSLAVDGTYSIQYTWYNGEGAQEKPQVTWIQNSGIAKPEIGNNFIPGSNTVNPGQGTITITLTAIGDPQYGTLQVKAGKFVRTVKLVSLANFSFTPVWTSSGLPMKSGEPVAIVFTIPDNFPKELYPLDVKLACNLFDDDGTNVDMNGKQTYLDVVTEVCDFTVIENGKEVNYKRNWPHKYVYTVDKPGLHRINFKTLIDNYESNPGEDPRIEFFLEANAFTTTRNLIYMNKMNKEETNYRIALGTGDPNNLTWATGNSANVTVPPAAGQAFDLHFKFYNGTTAIQPNPGEILRLYLDITKMKPKTTGSDLSKDPIFDPNKGWYYTYTVTVPTILRDTYNKSGVTIPMETVSSDCNTYLRISSQLNADGTFPSGSGTYRSAILTIGEEPANDFDVTLSSGTASGKELTIQYGPGIPVDVRVKFPSSVLSYSPDGFTGFIATKYLKPASGETRLIEAVGGYTFEAKNADQIFRFVTSEVGSEEVIRVSESGNRVAFNPAEVTLKNQRISGSVKLDAPGNTFDQANPFMSLERKDGTRIGVLAVTATKGTTEGTYTLDLRTEYKLDMDEEVFVWYTPMTAGDNRLFRALTSLRKMQDGEVIILNTFQ